MTEPSGSDLDESYDAVLNAMRQFGNQVAKTLNEVREAMTSAVVFTVDEDQAELDRLRAELELARSETRVLQGQLDDAREGEAAALRLRDAALTALRDAGVSMVSATERGSVDRPSFESALRSLLNRYSRENASNTPDYLLAEFLVQCLDGLDEAVRARDAWYGVDLSPGAVSTRSADGPGPLDLPPTSGAVWS